MDVTVDINALSDRGLLLLINSKLDRILMTNDELLAAVNAANANLDAAKAVVDKIAGETTGLVTEVQTLKDLLAAAGNPPPALQAAVDALSARVVTLQSALSTVDGLVPDAPAA